MREPKSPDQMLATLRAQLGVSVLVAVIFAAINHEKANHVSFYTTAFAAGLITFLVVNYLRTIMLLPPRDDDVSQPDPAQLTGSITSAVRSTYAISSNWLSLWRSPNFRYYLHLDAAVSLIAYSDRRNSYLLRISKNEEDLDAFYSEGLTLLDNIANDDIPVYKHRLRLLIYPQWVYKTYKSEMDQLIQSHSAARIPCIPLVAEELFPRLTADEGQTVKALVKDGLEQTQLDKAPPRPPMVRWLVSQRLIQKLFARPDWNIVFPDMLLVDAGVSHETAAVWWYTGNGEIKHRRHDDPSTEYAEAERVFRILCRHAKAALWNDYAPDRLGGVAIAASSEALESELFFARAYYGEWLDWIEQHRSDKHFARELSDWMARERTILGEFVKKEITERNASVKAEGRTSGDGLGATNTIRLLDVGCGTGRDVIDLLNANPTLHAVGIDIIERNISEAWNKVYESKLDDRAALFVSDAETLTDFGKEDAGRFDLVICMTNTLGNLTAEKQVGFVRRLGSVLRPGGRVLISVYSEASVDARLKSYRAIGLRVEKRGDHIEAAEGLWSQHFDAAELRDLLAENGLKVIGGVQEVTKLGWAVIAEADEAQSSEH
jgi:SAM-dependent methyltransferase